MGPANHRYVFIAFIILLTACSTQEHFRTLSFFFDGVPDPEAQRQAAITDSLNAVSADSTSLLASRMTAEFVFHAPYREKECGSCHNQGQMGSLTEEEPDLCYLCHIDFREINNFQHGPASAGYCTECHNPHRSKEPKLLVNSGHDLCSECHDSESLFLGVFHSRDDEDECYSCHDPHGDDNRTFLKSGSCSACHGNYVDIYPAVHGPVAGGLCSSCHKPHDGIPGTTLVREGKALCLNCHDAGLIMDREPHNDIGDFECIECHDPHGGEERYMLY